MKITEAIGAAFGTFSRIPVPKSAWSDFGSTHALAAFPLVGVAEGFLMTAWGHVANLLGVPATIVAAVLVALPVAVTGGIHLDGLCDTSDALASWAPRERKLEIMHDPRAGAFGVIGVVVYLILQFSLFPLPLLISCYSDVTCLCYHRQPAKSTMWRWANCQLCTKWIELLSKRAKMTNDGYPISSN